MLFCSDQGKGTTIKASLTEKTCSSTAPFTQETDYESEDDTTSFAFQPYSQHQTRLLLLIFLPISSHQLEYKWIIARLHRSVKQMTKTFKNVQLDGGLENCSVTLFRKFRGEKEMKETWRATSLREPSNFRATGKFVSPLFQRTLIHPTHHARKISYLILFSTKGGQKDHK